MAVVQGTKAVFTATTTHPTDTDPPIDPETGHTLTDPDDFVVTVWPPNAGTPGVVSWQGGTVERLSVGVFRFSIDTTASGGAWDWEAEATGSVGRVIKRTLRVDARRTR